MPLLLPLVAGPEGGAVVVDLDAELTLAIERGGPSPVHYLSDGCCW